MELHNIKVERILSEKQLDIAFKIRREVFVIEQEVAEEEEYDEFETDSVHYLASFNGQPCGTARWRRTDKGIKLERFAVLLPQRKYGVGKALLTKVLDEVPKDEEIYLHAQVRALGFYEKNGFKKLGELFWEAGIDHYKMIWKE